MIKIEHPDINKIASDYFEEIKDDIKERCDYLLRVFDVLFNGAAVNTISGHGLHGLTRRSITNQLLANNKLADQNHYHDVVQANCYPWVIANQNHLRDIVTHLNSDSHLKDLLLCSPDNAKTTENTIKWQIGLPAIISDEIKRFINSIIHYPLFDDYAYGIASKLGFNTCPYCNRNYINTVIDKRGKQIIRPTFDHFFPQTHHPFLALSFYNLVPSCYFCNSSLKSAATIDISTHIHPYKEGFDKDVTFRIAITDIRPNKSDPENYMLSFADNMTPNSPSDRFQKIFGGSRAVPNLDEGNINLFRLTDIYQSHLDIVGELRVKADKLNSWYGKSLVKMFPLLGTNIDEFYQFYFGNYLSEKHFNRRPLAKMTKDVVSQLIPAIIK